jgi:hypothetical protein
VAKILFIPLFRTWASIEYQVFPFSSGIKKGTIVQFYQNNNYNYSYKSKDLGKRNKEGCDKAEIFVCPHDVTKQDHAYAHP